MKALVRRVARVGDRNADAGCATCRAWPAVAFACVPLGWQQGDPLDLPNPSVCPACGRHATRLTRIYVAVDCGAV